MADGEGPRVVVESEAAPTFGSVVGDLVDAGWRSGRFNYSTERNDLPRMQVYDDLNDEIYALTKERLPNPVRQDRERIGGVRNEALGQNHPDNSERQWLARFLELTRRTTRSGDTYTPPDPRLEALIARALPEAISRRADEIADESYREEHLLTQRYGLLGAAAIGLSGLAGQVVAGDPLAAGQAFTGPFAASRTVLGTFMRWGAAGAIGNAFSEPLVASRMEEMGDEYTPFTFLRNEALAFGISGGLGVSGRAVGDAVTGQLGVPRPDPTRYSAAEIARDEAFRQQPRWSRERAILDEAFGPDIARDITDTLATRYEAKAAQALVDAAGRIGGQVAAREAAAGLRQFESSETREALSEREIVQRGIEPDEEAIRALDEADAQLRDLGETPEPPARQRETTPEEIASAERIRDDAPTPAPGSRESSTFRGITRPITFERLRPRDIGFDPAAFQYKRSTGATGDTGTLAGVEVFDPVASGKLIVFERRDGTRLVADGHQRLALAKRAEEAGQDVSLDAYVYREADGFTPDDVRLIAAQKNLREGAGDPLDVASILREAPDLLDRSIPLSGAVMRTGAALARLSDETLGAVRNGLITPEQGAAIARIAGDRPEIQPEIVRAFVEDPPRTAQEAEFIAREFLALPTYREMAAQMGLFGDAPLVSGMRERAQIMSAALRILKEDRRAFAAAERFADELESAGNVLAREENARRADAAAALAKELTLLATRAGPVADALREITADAVVNKTSAKVAGQRFADELVTMLNERGLLALKTGAPAAPVPAPEPKPIHETLERVVQASEIVRAHDADDAALRAAMAEAAVERAMRGEDPPAFADDALGLMPEEDLAAIDRALAAMEALGEPIDPTVREAAAAFLADADDLLDAAARERLAPKIAAAADEPIDTAALSSRIDGAAPLSVDATTGAIDRPPAFDFKGAGRIGRQPPGQIDKPLTFTQAAEARERVEAPWHPLDFDDEAKLRAAMDKATLPELAAAAGEFGVDATGSRAEVAARVLDDWRAISDPRFSESPRGWDVADATITRPEPMSPETVQRSVEKRFGKRTTAALLERGRLKIVQRESELPIFRGAEKFAREMATAETIERAKADGLWDERHIGPAYERVATPDAATRSEYAMEIASSERQILVRIDRQAPDALNVTMRYGGSMETGGGTVREGVEVFARTIAVLRYDMAQRAGRPVYTFAGANVKLQALYSRMLAMPDLLPEGYRAMMRAPDGLYIIAPVEADLSRFGVARALRPITKETVFDDAKFAKMALPSEEMQAEFDKRWDAEEVAWRRQFLKRLMGDDYEPTAEELKASSRALRNHPSNRYYALGYNGGGVRGMAQNGVGWIVADNVTPEIVNGIVLHEVGVHVGMKEMLGPDGFQQAMDAMDALLRAGDEEALAAEANVPSKTPLHLKREETLAYAVTNYENLAPQGQLRKLVDRIVASVRAWLWREFPALRDNLNLTVADLHALAVGALRHVARKEGLTDAIEPRFAMEKRNEPFWDDRLTPSENKAVEMARNGYSNPAIAEEMDVADVSVLLSTARAKAPDLEIPAGRARMETVGDLIARRMREGWDARRIVADVNAELDLENKPHTTLGSVRARMSQLRRAAGAPMQPQRPWTEADSAEMWRLRGEGLSGNQIAQRMQRAQPVVSRKLKEGRAFAMRDAETGALREGSPDDLMAAPNRLDEIVGMLKDCGPE